jgi:hypothetical protein
VITTATGGILIDLVVAIVIAVAIFVAVVDDGVVVVN